jgi:glutamine amidotransferase-like uncharacterized protein
MLGVHGILLAYGAWQHSPVHAEVQQLPAGLYHWEYGRFDFADVNPPLVRLVAALPLTWMSLKVDWRGLEPHGLTREEYQIGSRFVEVNGLDCRRLFFAGRIICIPFSLLGLFFCWSWAKRLYGDLAGLLAAFLWCFSPSVLGHGQLVSTDLAAASMALVASYYSWAWLRTAAWTKALVAGVALGAAALIKLTLLLLFPLVVIWAMLFVFYEPARHPTPESRRTRVWRYLRQCVVVFGIALYTINLAYCFEGVPFQPREMFFKSDLLRPLGINPIRDAESEASDVWFRDIWIPLPKSFVRGIDQQRYDFETPSYCYLNGQWKLGGWWYYYLYAFSIKTPLGTLAIGLLALTTLALSRRLSGHSPHWLDEFIPLSMMLCVLLLVSSQHNMSCHMRYVFPLLGFFFVLCSRSVLLLHSGSRWSSAAISVCLTWSILSTLSQYPHNLGYFNDLVGPQNGHDYLNYSNVDWGQDLFYLKDWYDEYPMARPLFLSVEALYNPSSFGIAHATPFKIADDHTTVLGPESNRSSGPRPGWYAVSKNNLIMRGGEYRYLRRFIPVKTIGSAINLYHLSLDDVNVARREFGFPLLPADWERRYHEGKLMEANLSNELASTLAGYQAHPVRLRVAVLCFRYSSESNDEEEQEICRILENGISCDCDLITSQEVKSGVLNGYDAILVPGGSSELMAASLGRDGSDAIREFVASGGGYVGICAGSFLATDRFEFCLNLVDAGQFDGTCETLQGVRAPMADRGSGNVAVKTTDHGQTVFATAPSSFVATYTGGPVFQDEVLDKVPTYVTLATYRSEIWRCEKQRGTMIQRPAAIVAPFERGRVLLFGFHPETQPETHEALLLSIEAVARKAAGN